MTTSASPAQGETRTCPHCKSRILKSASACPVCHHFLRFEAVKSAAKTAPSFQPLRIEGTVRAPISGKICEYSVLVAVHNDRGEEIAREVVAVGTLAPSEARTFTVWVEASLPRAERPVA